MDHPADYVVCGPIRLTNTTKQVSRRDVGVA